MRREAATSVVSASRIFANETNRRHGSPPREDAGGSDTPGQLANAEEQRMPEAELYNPIKQFLEAQGYVVKGEIGPCDVVAVRGDEWRPVVVELKERLSLALILQAVDRLAVSDIVYVAFRIGPSQSAWRTRRKQVTGLLRRLGLGLLTVSARGRVVPVLDPAAYRPTSRARRRERLLKEFAEPIGDPETGGSAPRQRVTAYRPDALRCARDHAAEGVLKVSVLRERTGVSRAGSILRDNHYGWFDRVRPGHYALSPRGGRELPNWYEALERLPSGLAASIDEGPAPKPLPRRRRTLHERPLSRERDARYVNRGAQQT